ncbi:MAG: MFS transporter [Planctomycetaceae bacterium]|nr:MFS transporter [Planctomycetaceae bacterium]
MDAAREPREAGTPARAGLLERLGLGRPELRAWALYDWANSAFFTTIVTAVFPVYYREVAADGRTDVLERFSELTTWSMVAVALVGPLLGALSDTGARKKPMLAAFLVLGVLATAALWLVERGDWQLASLLFVLGNIGVAGSFVFYDALLPSIASEEELDRVSTSAYALGYLGGGLLLALNLAWILKPAWFGLPEDSTVPVRLAFVSVAIWWAVFALPLLRSVKEPARVRESDEPARMGALRVAFARLAETARDLPRHRDAFLLMVAMLAYNDGINTIIRMATIYGAEIGLTGPKMIPAVLLVQFLGVPCAFGFGWLAGRIGPKRAVLGGIGVYLGITALAWRMASPGEEHPLAYFYALAAGVALVMGGCQALTRSMFASMVPRHRSGEFFGLFGVLERFSAILGPLCFGLAIKATGEPRWGVVPLVAFFLVGALLLAGVDLERGRRVARETNLSTP